VTWFYVDASFTAESFAPVISTSLSAPSLGRFYGNAYNTFASGAATVIKNDGWYNWSGGAPSAQGFGRFVTANAAALEFETES
jgi:hypothetical protein